MNKYERARKSYVSDIWLLVKSDRVESDEENKEEESEEPEVKVKLFKADKKSKNKTHSEEVAEEIDEKEATEPTDSGKNPSKKMKLSNQPSETPATTKKVRSEVDLIINCFESYLLDECSILKV